MSARIYFLRPVGQDGPIKIGFSRYPKSRLLACNAWSPILLEIVAEIEVPDGDTSPRARKNALHVEKRFHLKFARYRLHNEWFAASPTLLADIEAINAGAFSIDSLPKWTPVSELLAQAKAAQIEEMAAA